MQTVETCFVKDGCKVKAHYWNGELSVIHLTVPGTKIHLYMNPASTTSQASDFWYISDIYQNFGVFIRSEGVTHFVSVFGKHAPWIHDHAGDFDWTTQDINKYKKYVRILLSAHAKVTGFEMEIISKLCLVNVVNGELTGVPDGIPMTVANSLVE